jgi:hypothetical protein
MGELSGVERDAVQAAEVLASLADHLAIKDTGGDRVLRALAQEGSVAAERVLAYLRDLRGPGDGVATAYPMRLGPWREWCPPRGHVLHDPQVPAPRRAPGDHRAHQERRVHGDPGE